MWVAFLCMAEEDILAKTYNCIRAKRTHTKYGNEGGDTYT